MLVHCGLCVSGRALTTAHHKKHPYCPLHPHPVTFHHPPYILSNPQHSPIYPSITHYSYLAPYSLLQHQAPLHNIHIMPPQFFAASPPLHPSPFPTILHSTPTASHKPLSLYLNSLWYPVQILAASLQSFAHLLPCDGSFQCVGMAPFLPSLSHSQAAPPNISFIPVGGGAEGGRGRGAVLRCCGGPYPCHLPPHATTHK